MPIATQYCHVVIVRIFLPPQSSRVNISRLNYTENPEDFCLDTIRQTITIEGLTVDDAGTYKCAVVDHVNGFNSADFKLYVLDLKGINHRSNRTTRDVESDEFVFFDTANNPTTVNVSHSSDRPVRMVLGYESYPSLTSVEWYKDGRRLNIAQDHRYQATETDTELQLVISNLSLYDIGRYTVIARTDTAQDSYNVSVFIYDKPTLKMGSINTTVGKMVEFVCESHAFPQPEFDIGFLPCHSLEWRTCMENRSQYKNMKSEESIISIIEVHHTMKFQANVSGIVLCDAANDYGKAEAEGYLIVVHSSLQFAVEGVIISLFVVLTVVVVIVVRRLRRFVRYRKPPIVEDEELIISEQYEFPRERLRLGSLIGSGQFGVVLQAVADGIVTEGEETTVAVKLVRDVNERNVISVLIAELKVMIHIGHHLNVVNLLGAVTQNVPKNEMMMIVEHCKYGNVSDFLITNRTNFVDELDPVTGQYTSTRNFENLDLNDTLVGCTFRTSHLCSWATQIARGMSFLTARSVLHGDLAARNVLLCPDNVVKICDFGLARTLYRTNVYKKTSPDPLPLKWLALECISDRTFSTHSDVWAYGIVLWELFSLGSVPYPEQGNDAELVNALRQGYRMKKPSAANFEMYNIMLNCWRQEPTGRPSFEQLYQWFYNFLPQNIQMHHDQQLLTIDNNDGKVTILTDSCKYK
ncbi:hypothetical protein ZHAS_00012828 [Anopheles sinensis]|uniref:Receptor protein-tyrosine kinase n=1 Tax=Anopheles sinensis TaxID=74873 RepID=A0A084W3X1_ANOSI|nr:hypothetical protein ZHAS_00012828 [Anopheles sinensis]